MCAACSSTAHTPVGRPLELVAQRVALIQAHTGVVGGHEQPTRRARLARDPRHLAAAGLLAAPVLHICSHKPKAWAETSRSTCGSCSPRVHVTEAMARLEAKAVPSSASTNKHTSRVKHAVTSNLTSCAMVFVPDLTRTLGPCSLCRRSCCSSQGGKTSCCSHR